MMDRRLHPAAKIGKGIKKSARGVFPDLNRTPFRAKKFWLMPPAMERVEPEEHLAFDGEGQGQIREKRTRPRARRDQQPAGSIRAGRGRDAHPVSLRLPSQ